MELGGVSVPGQSARGEGAYLAKDLSVFKTELGGLEAFVMVSDATADDESGGESARLATQAADAYLESILPGIATGKIPVVEPASVLNSIIAETNSAILRASAEPGAPAMSATFCGALISADRVWFGRVGEGRGYLLRGDESRELAFNAAATAAVVPAAMPAEIAVPEVTLAEISVPEVILADTAVAVVAAADVPPVDVAPTATSGPALGHEILDIEIGSADLGHGDIIVLLGRTASAVLSGSDLHGISCAACDARVAASEFAGAAVKTEPEDSVTVVVWSADFALFAPTPPSPHPVPSANHFVPAVAFAASNVEADKSLRAERVFLWVMSGWIVFAILALGVGGLVLRPSSASTPTGVGGTTDPATGSAAVVATQTATATVVPTDVAQPEFPKELTVPKNVKGGLWLRRTPTTLGGTNEVATLKGGATIKAVEVEQGTDESGKTQDFYIINVSDISASQVVRTSGHPWPPSKSVKKVYVFAGSFE